MVRRVKIQGTNPYSGNLRTSEGSNLEDLVREITRAGISRMNATVEDLSSVSGVSSRRLKRFLDGGPLSFDLFQTLVTVSHLEPEDYFKLRTDENVPTMVDHRMREIRCVLSSEEIVAAADIIVLAQSTGIYDAIMNSVRVTISALIRAKGIESTADARKRARKMVRRKMSSELPRFGHQRLR